MVLSSARVVYKPRDCTLFGICKKVKSEYSTIYDAQKPLNTRQSISMSNRENGDFTIVADDCKDGKCDK